MPLLFPFSLVLITKDLLHRKELDNLKRNTLSSYVTHAFLLGRHAHIKVHLTNF